MIANFRIKLMSAFNVLFHKTKTLPQLKLEATLRAKKSLEVLKREGFQKEKKKQLENFLATNAMPDIQVIAIWLQKFFEEITEQSFKEKRDFLYQSRIDLVSFTETEYEEFYIHLDELEMEYITGVNYMIRREVMKIAPQEDSFNLDPNIANKYMWIDPGDDTVH